MYDSSEDSAVSELAPGVRILTATGNGTAVSHADLTLSVKIRKWLSVLVSNSMSLQMQHEDEHQSRCVFFYNYVAVGCRAGLTLLRDVFAIVSLSVTVPTVSSVFLTV
ncbi:unnamed protein product [Amoebophrya sp. A25]|nr:unnamed protein product [Amoebophrya sp. A25]|eukprot:GSA25T00026449001.1